MGVNPEIEPGAGVEVERIKALQNKLREQYAEFEGGLYGQLKELGQKGASKEWEDYLNGLTQHLDSVYSYITQPLEQANIAELEKISSTTDQFLTNAKNYLAQNNATEQKPESDQNNVVAEAGEDVKIKPFEGLKEKMTVAEPEEPQEEPTEKKPEESKEVSAQDLQNSFQDVYSALREYDKALLSQPPEGQAITDAEKEWIKNISEYYKTDYSVDDLEKIPSGDRVKMQATARDSVNYLRDLTRMLQREPSKGEVEKAEDSVDISQEPVNIPVEQKPEDTSEIKIGQTPEIPEGSEKLSRKQERINQATQKARERTENFIRDHITPYLELGTAREAGSINIFEKIDERWSKWRMEREMIHLKEALKVTQNNLAVYRQRSAKIEANIGKLSILAEQRPDLEKRLERLKTKLAPEIEELAGLINLQEALLKEYGNSLKVLAGALDVELEENVEAGINKGIPEISGGSGFSANNTDAYMTQYDSRIDGMFGTAGSSKELPRSMQGRRSAIEKFFMWFLGLENGVGLKSQEGVA